MKRSVVSGKSRPAPRSGFSLMEVIMVLAVISVLLAMAAPSFQRAAEQSQCNIAAANLQAIWAAQRLLAREPSI